MTTIGRNIAFARQQAIVAGVLTAVSLIIWVIFNRRIRYPASCLAILSFHPAWWMSAVKGACGHGLANSAFWASLLASGAIIFEVHYAARVRRSKAGRPGGGAAKPLAETGQ